MFSVVIPLYNKADYINKSIESVLNQSFVDFELIVVDDGSTDTSAEIAQSFLTDDHKLIRQQNTGVSAARNTGVANARHELIAFLDADDWWEPDFLQEMKFLIESHPEAGLYSSNFYTVSYTHLTLPTN